MGIYATHSDKSVKLNWKSNNTFCRYMGCVQPLSYRKYLNGKALNRREEYDGEMVKIIFDLRHTVTVDISVLAIIIVADAGGFPKEYCTVVTGNSW